jgi:hypothetical protein
METKHWKIVNDVVLYDYTQIEADLIRLGATPEEADALTDILHEEGWGEDWGDNGQFSDDYLRHKIWWYREFRAPGEEEMKNERITVR